MFDKISSSFAEFIYMLSTLLQLNSPVRVVVLVCDMAVVVLTAYYFYKLIKQTRAEQIFKGVILLIALLGISTVFDMVILKFLLTNLMTYGMLLFIVIFQPELRSAFEKIGRGSNISNVFDMQDNIILRHTLSEIIKAVDVMALKKIGALIVIERDIKVSEVLKDGITLSAKVSSELLQNIFIPRTPLHDGAVIIDKNTILAAKCILPLSSEINLDKKLRNKT